MSSENDTYKHMESPARGVADVRLDFSQHLPAGALKSGAGSSSSRAHTLYDHDLVMIFPRREGGELKSPEAFTIDAFVALLTGKDEQRSKRHAKVVIDPFARVLRTKRCFLDDSGRDLVPDANDPGDHSEKAEQRRLVAIEHLLESEYERVIGSREPTTEVQFCELVAMAIARRVQLACGLTTRMFLSCDSDEVPYVCCIL